ncbi:MAG: hypothetical protein WDW38_009737 [Sanguina aurantia]
MESAAEEGKAPMKKALDRKALTFLGIGFMLGAGIFVSPGYIAQQLTGPALFISYLVAAFSAFLSSFCYAEFTVDMPLAGAAYNYISNTLGEVIAWITVSNLILEYVLSNAAAVRGFAPYLALLCNQDSSFFLINWNVGPGYIIDFWAFGVTLVVTVLLQFGISESANVNSIITIIHLLLMVFIIIAGFVMGKKENFTPFIKQNASWWVSCCCIDVGDGCTAQRRRRSCQSFDAVATTAEEQIDPARDMPTAIIGAVGTVTVIYTLMSVVLSLMVPNDMIDQNATYASAFDYVGLYWAKYIVAAGALMGITTTTLIGVLGASRILAGCTRERMLPPFISWVNSRGTPWVSTWIIGIASAVIALITPFADLANMISIGTFVVFWVVAVALLFKRSYLPNVTTPRKFYILLVNLFAVIGFSLGFTLVWVLPNYQESDYQDAYVEGADYAKQKPLLIVSIFVNLFLLGQLDQKSYLRFGWWTVAAMGVYYSYSMIAGEVKDLKYEARNMLPTVQVAPAHDSLALEDVQTKTDPGPEPASNLGSKEGQDQQD